MSIDVDDLIRKEKEYHESIKPVDVEVLLGWRVLTVRIPYVHGEKFDTLAGRYRLPFGERKNNCWFDLEAVTREHPDVLLIDGDEQDDMFVLRDRSAVYRWPEVYDALRSEDQESLRAVIWGLHVHLPRLRLSETMKAKYDSTRETEGSDNG